MNGLLEIHPIELSEDDERWLEWQVYLSHKICEVFGISQQDLMGSSSGEGIRGLADTGVPSPRCHATGSVTSLSDDKG